MATYNSYIALLCEEIKTERPSVPCRRETEIQTKQPLVGVASLYIRISGRCAYWISTTVMPAPPKRMSSSR